MSEPRHSARSGVPAAVSASVLSTAVLAARGRSETGSAVAPTNAVSHAVWGDRAAREDAPSARFTLVGYAIHQAAALLWATLYERMVDRRRGPVGPLRALGTGAAVSTIAFVVDYTVTPRRFRPGYEKRLSAGSLALVYVAFGLGLTMRDLVIASPRPPSPGSRPPTGPRARAGSRAAWP